MIQKKLTYEHLDSGRVAVVLVQLSQEGDHWAARMTTAEAVRAPVFYGRTPDQAERQLRKVFDREYELRSEEVLK